MRGRIAIALPLHRSVTLALTLIQDRDAVLNEWPSHRVLDERRVVAKRGEARLVVVFEEGAREVLAALVGCLRGSVRRRERGEVSVRSLESGNKRVPGWVVEHAVNDLCKSVRNHSM